MVIEDAEYGPQADLLRATPLEVGHDLPFVGSMVSVWWSRHAWAIWGAETYINPVS